MKNLLYLVGVVFLSNAGEKPYEVIDHTADVGILAKGKSLEEVFANTAKGMFEIIATKDNIEEREVREISVEGDDLIYVYKKWLEELLYLFETEGLIFSKFEVEIEKNGDLYKIKSKAYGEKFNPKKHGSGPEIKAVTYHMMDIWKENETYYGQVIFDI